MTPPRQAHFGRVDRATLRRSFESTERDARTRVLSAVGPLRGTFQRFWDREARLRPPGEQDLVAAFDRLSDATASAESLLRTLRELSPGGERVGFRQVLRLTDRLRSRVDSHLGLGGRPAPLAAHDHAFGSGGDFFKTGHATTYATFVASSDVPICKTGTNNVTSAHGSHQAVTALGYRGSGPDLTAVDRRLRRSGFAYVALADLGFPYSDALREARLTLWDDAVSLLRHGSEPGRAGWRSWLRETSIPLDLLKIISPNAQVLNPMRHSTGVCHPSMVPYVMAIYLHLGSEGFIVHGYDGIDELSNAASSDSGGEPTSLVVHIGPGAVTLAELAPEDVGLAPARLTEIEADDRVDLEASDFWRVLLGEDEGPRRDFIAMNAGLLLAARESPGDDPADLVPTLREGVRRALELIQGGTARRHVRRVLEAHA